MEREPELSPLDLAPRSGPSAVAWLQSFLTSARGGADRGQGAWARRERGMSPPGGEGEELGVRPQFSRWVPISVEVMVQLPTPRTPAGEPSGQASEPSTASKPDTKAPGTAAVSPGERATALATFDIRGGRRILTRVEITAEDRRTRHTPYERLVELLRDGEVVVLSGAGLSTESGIPDYRGPDGTRRVTPMTYGEFLASRENRQRYWARSFVGWRRFVKAGPNEGHRAVAALQHRRLVSSIITQNVDGLHQVAGSRDVRELHGNLEWAVCLRCGERVRRSNLDEWLREANPDFEIVTGEVRPDGDVVLPDRAVRGFHPPRCLVCGSDLVKPDVVFFGESVPKDLVDQCFSLVEDSAGLVVLGSSLKVMSGYRFVRRAAALGLPVAIVTHGWSRGDEQATIRIDAPLGETLTRIVAELS